MTTPAAPVLFASCSFCGFEVQVTPAPDYRFVDHLRQEEGDSEDCPGSGDPA